LRRPRKIPDLVQKQRPAIGASEQPRRASEGAREGTAHVPEELRFDERCGNRAAIDGHERALAPREAVNGAREHLLPCSGLAQQKHRYLGPRHSPQRGGAVGKRRVDRDNGTRRVIIRRIPIRPFPDGNGDRVAITEKRVSHLNEIAVRQPR
jgi:hypothetical protein